MLISTLLLFGCAKAEIDSPPTPEGSGENNPDQTAVIGKQLPNPYALSTMKQAFRNLSAETRGKICEDEIVTTHLYVKFLPSNDEQLNSLLIQSDLDLFLFPLDRELSDGWIVDEPDYCINGFKHRWCSVPVERDLSNIDCPYEILAELFIPDEWDIDGNTLTRAAQNMPVGFIDSLVEEAYKICDIELKPISTTRGASVRPSGRIIAWDNILNRYVGNEGMKVKATRLFKTATGFCDANGYFSCDNTYKYAFDYHMHFDRDDFEIREGSSTSEIVYNKHDMRGAWNYTFTDGSKEAFWSSIFRAAFMYYYQNIDGLRRPPMNGFWKAKLAIQAQPGSNPNALGNFNEVGRFILASRPQITVYKQSGTTNRASINIFATTIHEHTHAVHWSMDHNIYDKCQLAVYESYSRGMEYYLTSKYYNREHHGQYWRRSYTAAIRDMIDGYKNVQSYYYLEPGTNSIVFLSRNYADKVTGYSITEIENAIVGCTTWNQWRDKIKSNYPNKTDKNNVDEVFAFWNQQ